MKNCGIFLILFGLLSSIVVSEDSLSNTFSPTTIPFDGDFLHEMMGNKPFDSAVPEFQIISENCTHDLDVFTEKVTDLTRCTLNNARPIRVCLNCEEEIKETQKSFNRLRSSPLECQQYYFGSDQVGIINLVYTQGQAVWTKNNCKNCYDHINITEKFFNVSRLLDACILKSNQTSRSSLNNTCDQCQYLFVELNDVYNRMVKTISTYDVGGVCMDVVDIMNITRRFWSTQMCVAFDSNIGYPNIFTAVFVGAMPVLFYLLSKNISIIEDVKLVRPKRKSFGPMLAEVYYE